jgi:hypothetical protein
LGTFEYCPDSCSQILQHHAAVTQASHKIRIYLKGGLMKVTYKTRLKGERIITGSVIAEMPDEIADCIPVPSLINQKACCDRMLHAISETPTQIDLDWVARGKWALCIHFQGYEDADCVPFDFCPFCGERVTMEEIQRTRFIKRVVTIPAKETVEYIEQPIKQ